MGAGFEADAATALVERAKGGDRSAFDELVRRYRDRILALALHLSGNAEEAEDITQEVFIKAYIKLPSFEGRSHFFTWVYRIAINRALNVRRSRTRRGETSFDDPRVSFALEVDAPDDPSRAAELRTMYSRLLVALDELPAPMKTTVVLVSLQGMSHGEAAIIQNCSAGTIAWRIHEARRRLRERTESSYPPTRRKLSPELTALLADWLPHPA
jgi:RNA polymerase sigma-70 factor (ECF subfamily)